MIDTFMQPFDFAMSLSVEQQFQITVAGCSVGFVCAAILRELIANPGVKWAARVLGCGAFFALVCFGEYATREVAELSSELMVRKAHDARSIVAQTAFVEVEVKTPEGLCFKWVAPDNGGSGSVPAATGRFAGSDNTSRQSSAVDARTRNGFDDVSDAKHAAVSF